MTRARPWLSLALAVALAVGVANMLAGGAQQQKPASAEALMGAALHQEEVEGNLEAAIATYEKVIADAQAGRALAARALLQLGACYEKLGLPDARPVYERIVREYADSAAVLAEARARLAALGTASPGAKTTGLTARQAWAGPDVDVLGSVSSDGRYLSYVDWDTGDLAIRELRTRENRRLTRKGSWNDSPEYAEFSAISPDGRQIAYAWFNKDLFYELRLIERNGGQPRVLYRNEEVRWLQPFDWSPDGKQLVAVFSRQDRTNQIVLVSVTDGSVRVLKSLDWRTPEKMAFSPDGRYVAYDFPPLADAPERDLFLMAADGSREVPLVRHPANDFLLGWFPDGERVLFASDRTGTNGAWAIRVGDGKPQGGTELVKPDIGHLFGIGFTKGGEYYYGQSMGVLDVYIATLDPATGKVVDGPDPFRGRYEGGKFSAVWSADGEHLAYLVEPPLSVRSAARTMSILTLKTGQVRDIPLKMTYAYRLTWLPDGRALIVEGTDFRGRQGLFRVDLSSGDLEPIVQLEEDFGHAAVSPDGRTLFYERSGSGFAIVMRDLATGEERVVYPHAVATFALSPDGRELALKPAISSLDGSPTQPVSIQLMPAHGGEPRIVLRLDDSETNTFDRLAWSQDGKYVLFAQGPDNANELWRVPAEGGTPQKLAITLPRMNRLSVHPDGRRLAISAGSGKNEVWVMENLLPSLSAAR